MPFSVNTLQKIAALLQDGAQTLPDLEAKAVSEKIGYQKDAVTTTLEVRDAGLQQITQQAEEHMNRLHALQNAFQNLTPDEVLAWITAVEANDTYDSPQDKTDVAMQAEDAIMHQAEESAQMLTQEPYWNTTFPSFANQLREAVDAQIQNAQTAALQDLDFAADLQPAENHVSVLKTLNDQTTGSLTQMTSESFAISPESCPFLLAVISRKNDYYGLGSMGTDTSSGGSSPFDRFSLDPAPVISDNSSSGLIANAPNLYHLVTGYHGNSTGLTGFYIPPHLEFLQGTKGVFSLQQLYTRYKANESVYKYPYAAVGIFALTNITEADISLPIQLEGSADSASYGSGILLLDNATGNWTPLYTLKQTHPNFGIVVDVPIGAQQTVEMMVITTAAPAAIDTWVSQFLSFTVSGFRHPGIRLHPPFLFSQGGL